MAHPQVIQDRQTDRANIVDLVTNFDAVQWQAARRQFLQRQLPTSVGCQAITDQRDRTTRTFGNGSQRPLQRRT